MAVSTIGGSASLGIQALVKMRSQLDDLQRQLSSGKKSDTYAGLGLDRGMSVGLRSQLAAASSFTNAITQVSTRINLTSTSLSRLDEIGNETKSNLLRASYDPDGTGQTTVQRTAYAQLDEILGLLNTKAGDRYLFSGRATDQPAVETMDHILNGDGAKAGLKQIISERTLADRGANGLGRLAFAQPTTHELTLTEASAPFGLKLAGVTSGLSSATVTGPTGAPPAISVDMSANPNAGETLSVRFTLPDGTTESITLTATTATPPGENQFTIGATADDTIDNLQTALGTSITRLADTKLAAASTMKAADSFFNADVNNPPMRVVGPPFDSATALTAGTTADTVVWYTGEVGSDPARSSATARIDSSITVAYGVRANEEGIRSVVQNMAVLAVTTYAQSDPNGAARSVALNNRVMPALDVPPGVQSVQQIETELASAQVAITSAKERHQQTKAALGDFLQQIEGVSNEEVAAQFLTLQTRLQASLQTTAMLYQTSLVNFL